MPIRLNEQKRVISVQLWFLNIQSEAAVVGRGGGERERERKNIEKHSYLDEFQVTNQLTMIQW